VVRDVYADAHNILLMYATAQNRLRRRAILQTVKLRAPAIVVIVPSVSVRTDHGSVD